MERSCQRCSRATLQGWVRGPSCPGRAPPPAPRSCKRSLPPCPPSSPSLNSPTASIDVLPASPSPAQPDSTWERQVKAAGPWEGSSCAPRGGGAPGAATPLNPPPRRDPGPGAAGRGFLAHPGGNQRRLGGDEAFSRPSQGLHGSVNTVCFQVHARTLPSSPPCSKPTPNGDRGLCWPGKAACIRHASSQNPLPKPEPARVFFSRLPGPQPVLVPSHLGFASARITVQLSWVLGAGNRVCTQGKCQGSARAWDAASFARAQVQGAVSFTRAQVPSLKPTHHFCPRILSGSRSAGGRPLGCGSGHQGGRESTPHPCTALLPCCVHAATRGAIFVPFLLFIVPEQCAVGEGCGVCFVSASFPPITFCLKTGFALILDPRPGNLGSMPWALALQGSWGTEIPGSDPDFDPKLSANTPHCPSAPLGTNCSPESPPLEHPQPLPSASSSTSTATLAPSLWNAQLPKADRWVSGNDRGEPSNRSHHERGGKN